MSSINSSPTYLIWIAKPKFSAVVIGVPDFSSYLTFFPLYFEKFSTHHFSENRAIPVSNG